MKKGIIRTTTYDNYDRFSRLGLSIFIDNRHIIADIWCDKINKAIEIIIKENGKVERITYDQRVYAIPAVEEILNCRLKCENYWREYQNINNFENDVYDVFNSS